ncbi:MAG: hypothetical protein KF816_07995 [Melioribacteraceae bacterium]|jgi:glucose-6-phosphate isomerase|nr:hypothetical protein [Melioribacteraceae bacterium]
MFLGKYQPLFEKAVEQLKSDNVVERIWQKDYTLWSDKPDEITNRLGWLDSAESSLKSVSEIEEFVSSVRSDGINQALLLGMGGSSLAPEVFRKTFGTTIGFLDLSVIDSTHPDTIKEYAEKIDPSKTLFIVSTKSGGTVETFSFMKFFYNFALDKLGKEKVGSHFLAITDPGSGLQTVAEQLNFRKIFLNDPNIGGRFSALSLFGIVPAALIGVDIQLLLTRAQKMADECKSVGSAALVGTAIGELAKQKRDKVTFVTSEEFSSFGVWVEQLIAESTGKAGKGILPVESESVELPEFYSNDRVFVRLFTKNKKTNIDKLIDAGHPVIDLELNDIYDLGAEFFRWEFATSVMSWLIKIQPFDQPNVESAKILARQMVAEYKESGKLPELQSKLEAKNYSIVTELKGYSSHEILDNFFALISQVEKETGLNAYISFQAYLKPDEKIEKVLQEIRTVVQKKYRVATTIGFGPRFLHSTGQLHKGDAGNGLFIQILDESNTNVPIPDEPGDSKSSMSFGVLIKSQALGDRLALLNNKRHVLVIKIKNDLAGTLKEVFEM